MSTAIALSRTLFDATLCLGVCDKIVLVLLIGAPGVAATCRKRFPPLPNGPMPSGVANRERPVSASCHAENENHALPGVARVG